MAGHDVCSRVESSIWLSCPSQDLHQSNPCQHLLLVLLYLCYVNGSVCCLCPAHLALQGLKNNPGCELSCGGTFRCPAKQGRTAGESQENGFRKHSEGKGWGESHCTPSQEGRAAEERSAGARSSALATLPKQLPPGLELPPLCKQPRPPPPAPGFDGADRAGRKTERAEKATYGDMGGFAG